VLNRFDAGRGPRERRPHEGKGRSAEGGENGRPAERELANAEEGGRTANSALGRILLFREGKTQGFKRKGA